MIGDEIDAAILLKEITIAWIMQLLIQKYQLDFERTPNMFSSNKKEENKSFKLTSQSKNNKDILRCYPLRASDGEIKWNMECIKILRLINAFNKPFGGAFSFINNEKIIIWDAKIVKYESSFCAKPGQILQINEKFVDVATKEDILRIFSIEVNSIIQKPLNLLLYKNKIF